MGDEIAPGWTMFPVGGLGPITLSPDGPVFEGETAALLRVEETSTGWILTASPAQALTAFGFVSLQFAFHPGDIAPPDSPSLSVRLLPGRTVDLLRRQLVDLSLKEWQVVDIDLSDFDLRGTTITGLRFNGNTTGTFYLDDLRLARGPDDTPIVTSIAPDTGFESGGTLVEVRGSNFHSEAGVTFGGIEAAEVRVVSPFLLSAVAPSHPAASADVAVANPTGETGALESGFRFVPDVFGTARDYAVGSRPGGIAGADLDGDGDHDLAVTLRGNASVAVLLNPGDGRLADGASYPTSSQPAIVAAADLDGDGDRDLAVSGVGVSVFANNGDGTFMPRVGYSPSGRSLTIADLDGDGNRDLAVTYTVGSSVSVLLNDGSGAFGPRTDYSVGGAGNYPQSVFAADLDGDGDVDLALAKEAGGVSVLHNSGDGSLNPHVAYVAETAKLGSVSGADLDGDGDCDLAATSWRRGNESLLVLSNAGDGSFALDRTHRADYNPGMIAFADVNGDGEYDAVVASVYGGPAHPKPGVVVAGGSISVWLNNGDGALAPRLDYAAGDSPNFACLVDLDGDDGGDLVVSHVEGNTVAVRLNVADHRSQPPTSVLAEDPGARPGGFALAQNYPNPFNGGTAIRFELTRRAEVELALYSLSGQKVVVLDVGMREPGPHTRRWDGRDGTGREVASGVYLYRLYSAGQTAARKMLLVR